jgi:hypothetical protein
MMGRLDHLRAALCALTRRREIKKYSTYESYSFATRPRTKTSGFISPLGSNASFIRDMSARSTDYDGKKASAVKKGHPQGALRHPTRQ